MRVNQDVTQEPQNETFAYAIADENLRVLRSNWVMDSWAINPIDNIVGLLLTEAFPELIGIEQTLRRLPYTFDEAFTIAKIHRPSTDDDMGRYFNLHIEPLPLSEKLLLVQVFDVTHQARLEQALRQERNDLRLSIIERERTEQALRTSETRYRKLIEAIPDPIIILNLDGGVIAVNEATLAFISHETRDTLIGYQAVQFIHPDDHALLQKKLTLLSTSPNSDEAVYLECKVKTQQEQFLHVEARAKLVTISDEHPPEIIVILRDITDHKSVQKALKQRERDLAKAQQMARVGSWTLDLFTKQMSWSHEMYRIFGVDNQTVAPNFDEFMQYIDADSREMSLAKMQETMIHGETVTFEQKIVRPSHEVRFLQVHCEAVLKSSLVPVGVVGTVQDVTDQKRAEESMKQSEARYRAIVEDQTELISRYQPDLTLTFVNEAYCRFFGKSAEALIGQSFTSLYQTVAKATALSSLEQLTADTPVNTVEYPVTLLNGNRYWLQWTNHLICNADGDQLEYQSVGRDITKLKAIEEQLREINSGKDKFFSIISHDLRSPFGAVLGYTEYLLHDLESFSQSELREMLQIIKSSSDRLYQLLENLLTWSRLQRNDVIFEPTPLNTHYMVEETIHLFTQNARQKNIRLINDVQPDIEIYVDMNVVQTVLRNLMGNALKFTPDGGTVTITARVDHEQVEITVTDTGVGLSEKAQATIFRIDEKYTTEGTAGEKGTGLGLILCRELIEKSQGQIWIDSEVGQGAAFKFTLPRHIPQTTPEEE